MSALIPIALLGWIPVILLIFASLPPRRAAITAYLVAWLFLPLAGYSLSGLPNYTKYSATSLGTLLATVIFCSDRLFALRFRWFDLPMTIWSVCPFASSLSNGLGAYDGLSQSFDNFVLWGLPYLIGRVYFTRAEHLRELAIGIVMGGLVYVPLCAWEMKMSPNLHRLVYGIDVGGWGEMSFGGYRPKVFMGPGLEVALWMSATGLMAFWLWIGGVVKQIRGTPFGWHVLALLTTAVLCRVAGAWFLLCLGLALWYLVKWSGSRIPILVMILVPVVYLGTRSTGLWGGDHAVKFVRSALNERRAESLDFRLRNENLLVAKALERPIFGWGGWARARVYNEESGKDMTITDGLWVIALGNHGLVGLVSLNAALLLPMVILLKRYPARAWQVPAMVPACVLATLNTLYAIDSLANAKANPIYLFALGGLTGVLGTLDPRRLPRQASRASDGGESHDGGDATAGDPREEAAIGLGVLGRSLMEQGHTQEAEEAWLSGLQQWAGLAADYPDDPTYRRGWLDALNDSAWSLIANAGPDPRGLARGTALAEQAVGLEPANAAYWNTLGIAYFRQGEWAVAVHALERSNELGDGGTSFDYYFLAMAHWHRGDKEQARRWFSRADDWMREHNPDHVDLLRFRAEASALLDSQAVPV